MGLFWIMILCKCFWFCEVFCGFEFEFVFEFDESEVV